MAKTILGIDIGSESLKLVLFSGNKIKKSAIVPVPENVIKDGNVVSVEAMAETLKEAISQNKIRAAEAAVVLSGDNIFVRNVRMPVMNHEQLMYNLKYEFKDYITNESKDYVFDYAMISTPEKILSAGKDDGWDEIDILDGAEKSKDTDDEQGSAMDLMAVVAPREVLDETSRMVKKAGLKLVKAAPPVCAVSALIRNFIKFRQGEDLSKKEFCVLDLGYSSIRMHMFKGDAYNVTRALEMGLSNVDLALADSLGVDVHLAHTYIMKNHDDCQNSEVCLNAYDSIAVELMRVLNFYRFSNPDSNLTDIWICGGGVGIPALRTAIEKMLDMQVHMGDELISNMFLEKENGYLMLLAAGIVME